MSTEKNLTGYPSIDKPCEIAIYEDFPRTNRGKVDYRALEKEAEKL